MAIFKCKMCGGNLELQEGVTVAECEYCGSTQTVPTADNEKKMTLFSRANRLRAGCEFDKAAGVYESIVADFPEEAEAYWGLVLCKYGIEYVDDPTTGKKIPTCHRSGFDSVLEDSDFEQACENADAYARRVYRDEAKQIEELRKSIISVSANEKPYDIFICYKETSESGERTLDSVLAQDIYDALTGRGYRVFFSRVTLEDKLGMEYEPYIFAALNSARIMLAVGTDYEYYNAVWVKNEWSRYLKLMAQDKGKHLIPCFKDIDAYDMPREFARLQAQDMGKVGAMQDLLRGIEKIVGKGETDAAPASAANSAVEPLLKRAFMFLEDGDWKSADEYCEKVLDADPENAQAYLGKLLAQAQQCTLDAFVHAELDSTQMVSGEETLRLMPDAKYKEHVEAMVETYSISGYVTKERIRALYRLELSYHSNVAERKQQYQAAEERWAENKWLKKAERFAAGAVAEELRTARSVLFDKLTERIGQAEAAEAAAKKQLLERLEEADARAKAVYEQEVESISSARETRYQSLLQSIDSNPSRLQLRRIADELRAMNGYRDSEALIERCLKRIDEMKAEEMSLEVEKKYQNLLQFINGNPTKQQLRWSVDALRAMNGYRDSEMLIERYLKRIDEMEAEEKRLAEEKHLAEEAEKWRLVEERHLAEERAKRQRLEAEIAKLRQEQSELQAELADLKGLFTGRRRREIEARLAEIEKELRKLS